jgi:predicted nuclease of predicted toxin-antitoxin system
MKFLIDLALTPKIVKVLRDFGYEAVRVNELGMANAKDKELSCGICDLGGRA